METPLVFSTGRPICSKIVRAFAEGCGGTITYKPEGKYIATYGIKRGSDVAIKQADNFWYIDHGYVGRSTTPHMCDGYYRICLNALVGRGQFNIDNDRRMPPWAHTQLSLKAKLWKKDGSNIILCPPSSTVSHFNGFTQEQWINEMLERISVYSNRSIYVSDKNHPASKFFDDAWMLITYNSNVQVEALLAGIPTISTSPDRLISKIANIENPLYEREWIYNLPNEQWTLAEMKSGQAWRELNDLYEIS